MTEAERQRQAEAWAAHHRALAAEAERQQTAAKRDGQVAVRKRGSRGPRKGDGGRPAYRLDTDPDRRVIVAALWYWRTREAQRSFEVLQLLDNLFAPADVIDIESGDNRLTITNTADRIPGRRNHKDVQRNVAPDRRPWAAPNGKAFRKSRLQDLRDKIDRCRRAKLTGPSLAFYNHSILGLGLLAIGNPMAQFALASAGWTISEVEGKRLAAILAGSKSLALDSHLI
jgi:hypothetical protein